MIANCIFILLQAPNGVEIESFIFAPVNACNSINDHLHCLVTSAPTSVQPTPPGQEPAIPGKSQFAEMFHSQNHMEGISWLYLENMQ